ncbi:GAF domain-containing protein [Cognatilysobacter tabacisoli]|uniref:GAF domain-containing protein n=1 Tax=Cognatilysobacter tabacisoli TaxID=2315424 RepID=UPI000E6B40CC|nr:GAF domain-containing protein [Lysobacter tabacisoli]
MTTTARPSANDCARDPIHLCGAIQPHGYLVSCELPSWTVRHVSTNIAELFEVEPEALVGQSLRDHVGDEVLDALGEAAALSEPGQPAHRAGGGNFGALGRLCDLTVHVADGLVHIEIEPQPYGQPERMPSAVAQAMIARLSSASDDAEFHHRVAEQVRQLTGYDRVMVYRFRADDSGEVIAESCPADMEPFLGLRYPASDIPPQARWLYLRNRLRVIPDANYHPVSVLPALRREGLPLDLSQHVLRSVAPVHLEYLHNMGVAASMSISIVSGDRLWGLIACHHRAPRRVPPGIRAAAELFGLFVSMRVAAREQDAMVSRYLHAQHVREAISDQLARAGDAHSALVATLPQLRSTLESDGAALLVGGERHEDGRVPSATDWLSLRRWLQQHAAEPVAMTDVAEDWRTPNDDPDGLAGVMAIHLGGGDRLLLFRREQIEDVRWAGDPDKAMVPTDDGQRIAPRKSFATWVQTVRGRAEPWSEADRRGAARLHALLREQRWRAAAHARQRDHELDAIDQHSRRHAVRDHQHRLDGIASLLDGLVHLDGDATRELGSRIARLEQDIRDLMQGRDRSVGAG